MINTIVGLKTANPTVARLKLNNNSVLRHGGKPSVDDARFPQFQERPSHGAQPRQQRRHHRRQRHRCRLPLSSSFVLLGIPFPQPPARQQKRARIPSNRSFSSFFFIELVRESQSGGRTVQGTPRDTIAGR